MDIIKLLHEGANSFMGEDEDIVEAVTKKEYQPSFIVRFTAEDAETLMTDTNPDFDNLLKFLDMLEKDGTGNVTVMGTTGTYSWEDGPMWDEDVVSQGQTFGGRIVFDLLPEGVTLEDIVKPLNVILQDEENKYNTFISCIEAAAREYNNEVNSKDLSDYDWCDIGGVVVDGGINVEVDLHLYLDPVDTHGRW